MLRYRALMSSLCASIASESLFLSLMAESGLRPAFSFTNLWNEYMPEASTRPCCTSMLKRKLWNSRARVGTGRGVKDGTRSDDEWRALASIDDFHRRTTFSQQHEFGLDTVCLHGTLAAGEPVRRIAR